MALRSFRWASVLGFAVLLVLVNPSLAQAQRGRVAGRWIGQDGNDFCGARIDAIKPNEYQDVHIALRGIDTRRKILEATLRGYGSGEWRTNAANCYGVVIERKPGSSSADLFFEPDRVETGREFNITLKFEDGSETIVDLKGGKANPDLRMPGTGFLARWVGQVKSDHAGSGPGVGPDGFQDARISLTKLAPKSRVVAIVVEDPSLGRWAFGSNPDGFSNAEFTIDPKDPARGHLDFQPDRDLAGHKLKVTVAYESDKKDSAVVAAGRTDPKLAMHRGDLPKVTYATIGTRWLGQDGAAGGSRGDVHLALSGLPSRRPVAVVLSDSVRGIWAFRAGSGPSIDIEADALPLVFQPKGATADLFFSPVRDESKSSLTLRLVYADGESVIARVPGGACDPALRGPEPEKTEAVVRPGDDLAAIVNRAGTVRLMSGEYRLKKPLILDRPVTIVGEPGSILLFDQPASEPPWTTALKIHAGNTTLRGFAIRFAGPIRWKNDVAWGPAVIGTTDNLDAIPSAPKFNLVFEHLDIEGPPSTGKSPWEEAVRIVRSNNAMCGRIENNVLKGGLIELFGGPWQVTGNDYRGTPADTYTQAVVAAHDSCDLVVSHNKAKPIGPGGKVWRFLVLTGRGSFDRVENNIIEQIGPRDDDTKKENAPEIILTESYHLGFEGRPVALSADGQLVKVGEVPGRTPRTGDVVAVVAGQGAGQWRRIAQRIEPDVYYLDAPLPKGAEIISVSQGFIDEVFAGNQIDARDGRDACCLVLAGNHYGTKVVKNRFLGAGDAFRLLACPTETPFLWGWSHAPFLGSQVEGNIVEDSERGGTLAVEHGGLIKSNKGRVYMTVTVKENVVRWSEPFLSRMAKTDAKHPKAGITLGTPGSLDPGELVVTESGNRLDSASRGSAASALQLGAAIVNGRPTMTPGLVPPPRDTSAKTGSGKRDATRH